MASIDDMASVKGLRSTVFADLFYEVLDSSDKQSTADAIAERLEPSLATAPTPNENLERLVELRKMLKERRKDRKRWERLIGEDCLDEYEEDLENIRRTSHKHFIAMRSVKLRVDEDKRSDLDAFLEMYKQARESADASGVDYGGIVDDLLKPDDCEDLDRLIDQVVYAKPVYRKTVEEIDSRLDGYTHVSPEETFSNLPKHVKALLLIPKLENDQDMIVFFGNNFHKAFEDVNAYTGLLYAYEYFEFLGMA